MSEGERGFSYDAVLLLAYGGPTSAAEVEPFLRRLMGARGISPERLREIAERYRAIGGFSPLVQATLGQAEALRQSLARAGARVEVQVGMRTGSPSIREALESLVARGAHRVLVIIMTPFESGLSHGRYQSDIDTACQGLGSPMPEIAFAPSYYRSDGFIRANAESIEAILNRLPSELRERALLVFTAHSLPQAANPSAYSEQFAHTAAKIASVLGLTRYRLAYQSRSGAAGEAWLGPSILQVIEVAATQGMSPLVVAPVGFICDNLEVLYDLDIEAAAYAVSTGATLYRCATVGAHPAFIQSLVDLCV